MSAYKRLLVGLLALFLWITDFDLLTLAAGDTAVSELIKTAEKQWGERSYDSYIKTCLRIESVRPRFGVAFNVALGMYAAGRTNNSAAKLHDIEKKYTLSNPQAERIRALHTELRKAEAGRNWGQQGTRITIRETTTAIQSRDSNLEPAACPSRTAECLGLKPSQAREYIEQLYEAAEYGYGFNWLPEPEPIDQ